jgi:hypothetical protein
MNGGMFTVDADTPGQRVQIAASLSPILTSLEYLTTRRDSIPLTPWLTCHNRHRPTCQESWISSVEGGSLCWGVGPCGMIRLKIVFHGIGLISKTEDVLSLYPKHTDDRYCYTFKLMCLIF